MSKITVARALSARVARRVVTIATIVGVAVLVGLIAVTWALAYYLSAWWWLLLLPIFFLFGLCVFIRLLVEFIVRRIHVDQLTKAQNAALDDFTDKLQRLIEARATPPLYYVVITMKDLLIYRDITTIKKLITDSVGLRRDYRELEKLF